MNSVTKHSICAIDLLQDQIKNMGYVPIIQFELEGTFTPHKQGKRLDFRAINVELQELNIQGKLKPEYWELQWEFASTMQGQNSLTAAEDLSKIIKYIPSILKKYGASKVYIKPVSWGGIIKYRPLLDKDYNRLDKSKIIHIPNSVQINISALNADNENAILKNNLGEILQQCLLRTSQENCLLYSPEPEAFERLQLKNKYDLHKELSCPVDISGGNQGSIAFYKEHDKNNNKTKNWKELSRVEHRLGSASSKYNPYLNCVLALANLHDAIILSTRTYDKKINFKAILPETIVESHQAFRNSIWIESKLNNIKDGLGTELKDEILSKWKIKSN